ncbi:ORF3 [Marmot associated torque teno virus]|nr:ORF3 [Marmot associated torque teno virus]
MTSGLQIEPPNGASTRAGTPTNTGSLQTEHSTESPQGTDHSDQEFSVLLREAMRSRKEMSRQCRKMKRKRVSCSSSRHTSDAAWRKRDAQSRKRDVRRTLRELLGSSESGTETEDTEDTWPTGSGSSESESGSDDPRNMDHIRDPQKP